MGFFDTDRWNEIWHAPNGVDTAACICSAYSCREDKTRLAGLLHPAKIPPAAPAASRHKQNFLNPFIIPHTPKLSHLLQKALPRHSLTSYFTEISRQTVHTQAFCRDKPKSSNTLRRSLQKALTLPFDRSRHALIITLLHENEQHCNRN